MGEQDKEEIQDSLDKKKEGKGGHFWAGVLTGALIMALAVLLVVGVSAGIYITGRKVIHTAVFRWWKWCSGYYRGRKGHEARSEKSIFKNADDTEYH